MFCVQLDSLRKRLDGAIAEKDKAAHARNDLEREMYLEKQASAKQLEKMEDELASLKDNNQVCYITLFPCFFLVFLLFLCLSSPHGDHILCLSLSHVCYIPLFPFRSFLSCVVAVLMLIKWSPHGSVFAGNFKFRPIVRF
jgi:hypothetical protein